MLFKRKPKVAKLSALDAELFQHLMVGQIITHTGEVDSLRLDGLKRLLAKGANPNTIEPRSKAPLWMSALEEPALLDVLLQHGVDLAQLANRSFRFSENAEVLGVLIKHGLDPQLVSPEGQSLLHYAWEMLDRQSGTEGTQALVELVLEKGAPIDDLEKCGVFRPYQKSVWMEGIIRRCRGEKPETRKTPNAPRHPINPLARAVRHSLH